MKVVVHCPAKINTFLAVGPVDAFGYHPIRTIFQAVGLYDIITIESATETTITSDWPDLPSENTVTKTLRFLSEYAKVPPLRIHLEKVIPTQSGLGGGSSDAAGLLKGIQGFLPAPIPAEFVQDIAAAVGKDVPFFLHGGRAKGEGYGEIISPSPFSGRGVRSEGFALLAQPKTTCSTPQMYAELDNLKYEWRQFPVEDELYNDFEQVAPFECLDLIAQIQSHGLRAGLTGSGSAVFGLTPSRNQAEEVAKKLECPFVRVVPLVSWGAGESGSQRVRESGLSSRIFRLPDSPTA